jgi:hypothetical protein
MSDQISNKIQTSSPNDLPGGQHAFVVESHKSTKGFDSGEQNNLAKAQGRGVEVNVISRPIPSRNGLNDGAAVTGVSVAVRSVDRKTIEGSTPGDSRAHGAPAVLPANPGPREPKGQTPNGELPRR